MKMLARRRMVCLGTAVMVGAFGRTRTSLAQTSARPVTIKSAAPSLTIAVPLAMVANHTDTAHGIAVDEQAGGTSSTVIIDAVLAGQAGFGTPGTADALQAIRQGAKLKIIAAVVNNLQVMVIRDDVMQRLGISPTAPIADRVRALKGLTIGTGAVGSTHYQILRGYLKQYGIDPDNDVRLVGMAETSGLISGIEQKRYDAIAYASPIVDYAIAKHVASVWISGPRGDVPGFDNVKTCVVVARPETIEQHRDDVDALRAALVDALNAVRSDHAATGEALHGKYFSNLDPAVWAAAWNGAASAYPPASPSRGRLSTIGPTTIQKARTPTRTSITRRSRMLPRSRSELRAMAVMNAGPLLRIADVAVRFTGPSDVLSETSLTIDAGEFVTLLGPSGCGKSTLLNLTAGTLRPRQGTIHFDGKPVVSVNRSVGYVTQDDTMLPWLSLAANVGLPLTMRRVSRAETRTRVMDLLTGFGLDAAASLYPAQLSGGMKKRGLLARALIYRPRLLLMDEPFAALDAQLREQLQRELRRVVQETGVAVLFVTHDLE